MDDDAATYRINADLAVVQTVDFITPIVNDPQTFGAIAAANALSDIYAMGATPIFALNIVSFPIKSMPMEILGAILAGGAEKMREAGISLMAINFLQFAVPHGKGLIKSSDIPWTQLSISQITMYLPLTLIMLGFTLLNLILIVGFLKSLVRWVFNKEEYNNFISNPSTNIGAFVPIASLSMTANVIWGPLAFFVPQLSSHLQAIMLPI